MRRGLKTVKTLKKIPRELSRDLDDRLSLIFDRFVIIFIIMGLIKCRCWQLKHIDREKSMEEKLSSTRCDIQKSCHKKP